jgi:hypothetical protein
MSVAKTVLLAKAPALARFADDDFDEAAAMAYTSAVLGSGSAASATHQLSEGTQALEGALRAEVLSRHVELLQQVSRCAAQALTPCPRASPDARDHAAAACATRAASWRACALAWRRCRR